MDWNLDVQKLVIPLLYIIGGIGAGLLIEKILLAKIRKAANRTKWRGDGDYVKLDTGEEGYVSDITWRNTTIRALSNDLIIVPNSKLASAIIRNYQLPDKEIAVLVEVGVGYGSDLEKVEQLTVQTAKEIMAKTEGGIKNFEPFIRYHTFGEAGIKFTTILRGEEFVSQYLIKHEFIKALHKRFKSNSIEIPFPTHVVFLRNKELN